jgi:tyrosyl-tRNA synthetase
MAKILTDKALIEKFLERGVDSIYPDKEALRKRLLSGEKLRAYQGFDPTGPYLHIGHAMGIRALRILQQLGHEVIFLVGDFTARVGDPHQDKTRELLTEEQVKQNADGWKKQASQLINFGGKNPVKFKYNYQWLSKLQLHEVIELMSKTTVQQVLERDLFQNRLKENKPIALQEFIYPLLQGYDSVAMKVDIEIGGTDQIFNMLMGRTLCKIYLEKEKYVRANTLMEAPDALTMSKTKGNGINLSDEPHEMYGKAMSYSDDLIIKGLKLLTDVPLEEIEEIAQLISQGENPMQFKKFMAFEIVKSIKGESAAEKAQLHFEKTVQEGAATEESTTTTSLKGKMTLIKFLKETNPADFSSGELKRMVQQGGVEINGEKVTDIKKEVEFKKDDMIKIGKRNFVKVI